MRIARLGLLLAALAGLLVAGAPAAPASSTVVVRPEQLQGWTVEPFPTPASVPYAFSDETATTGEGSVQFGPISGDVPANKFILRRDAVISAADLDAVSFDFYIDPAAANRSRAYYYLNVYVDVPDAFGILGGFPPGRFYDCRYDVNNTGTLGAGWETRTFTRTSVVSRFPTTCPTTLAGLPAGSVVFRLALNGGDTSGAGVPAVGKDAGLKGGFDTVAVTVAGDTTTYDFEPTLPQPASANDCKKSGWQSVFRADGSPFANQGDCIQYVNTGN